MSDAVAAVHTTSMAKTRAERAAGVQMFENAAAAAAAGLLMPESYLAMRPQSALEE
jgi:Zn-dependent peptidase ImmA (M78 family)